MRYRVLCIEDETDFREDICEYLALKGYDVTSAPDGLSGCEKLNHEKKFDLVLCDIRMPGCDGYDVVRALRMLPDARQYTPFIFLSAMNDVPDMLEGRARGCDEYLVKPLNLEVLEATVRGRIERDRVARFMEQSIRNGLQSRMASLLLHDMALPFMELSHLSAQLQESMAEALPRKAMEKAGEIRRHAQTHAMRAQLIAGFDSSALRQGAQPMQCASYGAQVAARVFGNQAREALHMVSSGECSAVPLRELTLALSMLLELAHARAPQSMHGMMIASHNGELCVRIADRMEHLAEEEYSFYPWRDDIDVAAMGTALDGRMMALLYAERLTQTLGGSLAIKSVDQHFLVVECTLPSQLDGHSAIDAMAERLNSMREGLILANENHYH